jgi:hypothetical protein
MSTRVENESVDASFCNNHDGNGIITFMDGFHSISTSTTRCLNYYFPTWTLSTKYKFVLALVVSFLMPLGLEKLAIYRSGYLRKVSQNANVANRAEDASTSTGWRQSITSMKELLILQTLYAAQQLGGYAIMLLAMTFSVEIFACVLLGLGFGQFMFVLNAKETKEEVESDGETDELRIITSSSQCAREKGE